MTPAKIIASATNMKTSELIKILSQYPDLEVEISHEYQHSVHGPISFQSKITGVRVFYMKEGIPMAVFGIQTTPVNMIEKDSPKEMEPLFVPVSQEVNNMIENAFDTGWFGRCQNKNYHELFKSLKRLK